ncbi:arginase family protein [Microbacterium elymi]|uniref:Arginase family protein n=1 Tax=Microbacterium elymi TaxID=2909587 RepID=A0ABY5NKH1_9MICO|nr:arginase family protein [Microbacterium elymi]UUT35673.1 arginase family protein [Microbacterium elymi]
MDVPMEAGESLDSGVHRLSALQHSARAQLTALADIDEPVLTVGGDAGVATTAALAAIGATGGAPDPDAVVVWFSAHAGLHDPESSPTGAYDSMAVRALVDERVPRPAELGLAPDRLILVGVREIHPAEAELIERLGVAVVPVDELGTLADAVAARRPSGVFIHVDLDVLDPAAMTGLSAPEPFGPDVAAVTSAISDVRKVAPLLGGAITEFSPASPSAAVADLGAILRIVGALA